MLDHSMINPYIRVAQPSVMRAGREIRRRIIFDYELIYIEGGTFVLNNDDVDYTCTAGQFLLLRPGISHSFSQINEDLHQPHIHFDITHPSDSTQIPVSFKDIGNLNDEERKKIRKDVFAQYPTTPYISFSDTQAALRLFYRITNPSNLSALARKAALIQLLDMLISDNFPEVFQKNAPLAQSIESQVKDYIDAGQGLTSRLEDIAKQFNYSKFYLDRCFKVRYVVSIMAYRNMQRMRTAKEMLKHNSVSAVTEKLGFSSIYVFSRAFKNYFGVSPSVYTEE